MIQSPRFGQMKAAPERVIEFPNGLPGFEDSRLDYEVTLRPGS